MKMKNFSHITFVVLTILVVLASLFGQVTTSHAQDDQGWTSPVNLSFSGLATNPSLVIDARNTLHAIWLDDEKQYMYSQSSDDGVTWATPQAVNFPFSAKDSRPTLFADANGSIHIFWISSDGVLFHGRTSPLEFARPSNWESSRSLATNVIKYALVEDLRGRLHIAYIRNESTATNPAGVYYRQSGVGGATWNEAIRLYESEYFRATKESESFISVAASHSTASENVYVTWDSQPQKRVFMAMSQNGGSNWRPAQQIKGPEDTGGVDTPFNLNVAAAGDKILLVWQMGKPGSEQCLVFSQLSENLGESWGILVPVLDGRTDCPASSRFILQQEEYMVLMMTGQGTPIMAAWNGGTWSKPQIQTQLPSFSNPLTYDAILLGCRFDLIHQDRLYVAACDEGGGGDVWFMSRSLNPVDEWFAPSNSWNDPVAIPGRLETLSSFAATADSNGYLHSMWVETSLAENGTPFFSMEYTRWDGKSWTRPEPVIYPLTDAPTYLASAVQKKERLLLTWIDGGSGDLLFSWVNLDRANLATEWAKAVSLPAPSSLITSPDMLVDGAGRVVVTYAVPLNEERGIYVVQSPDSRNWSAPVRVFDAVSAHWIEVGDPRFSLGQDGILHLIFSRKAVRSGQPVGLYYSRSVDGGTTWSESQILSEADILWSDIVTYDDQSVHVVWQEYDGLVYSNLSKVSKDGGLTWGKLLSITGVNDKPVPVTLAADELGTLHFIQALKNEDASTVKQDSLIVQDWEWNGLNWDFASERSIVTNGSGNSYSVSAGITPDRFLAVAISGEYVDSENKSRVETQTFSRFLGRLSLSGEPVIGLLPTPSVALDAPLSPETLPTQTVDLAVLQNDNVSTTSTQRNIVGVVIIGVGMLVTAFLLMRTRSGPAKE